MSFRRERPWRRKRPFDYEGALSQIAAAIGLHGPEEFLARSQVEGTPDYRLPLRKTGTYW